MNDKELLEIYKKEWNLHVWLSYWLICVANRYPIRSGYWWWRCGYVLSPQRLSEEEISNLSVHRWITYAAQEQQDWFYRYWFDCWHAGDLHVWMSLFEWMWYVYRDIEYVKKETNNLAAQVRTIIWQTNTMSV